MGKENLMQEPIMKIIPEAVLDHKFEGFDEEDVAKLLDKHKVDFYVVCQGMKDDRGLDRGITVSAALNRMMKPDPSGKNLDGFDRMLRYLNIPVQNDANYGVYTGTMDLFYSSQAGTALIPEFINRELRKIHEERYSLKGLISEQVYTPNGLYEVPEWDLSELDAGLRPVGEKGEFPRARLGFSSVSGKVAKRGVILEASYEVVRRMNINVIRNFLQRVAVTNEADLMGELLETLLNAQTAIAKKSWNDKETNDSGTLLYDSWLTFMAGTTGLRFNKVAGNLASVIKVMLMQKPSVDPIQLSSMFATLKKSKLGESVSLRSGKWEDIEIIDHADVPAGTLVAWDSKFAAIQYTEAGLNLIETGKVINRQFHEIVISMGDEFAVPESATVRKMDHI